jgi:DNA-binding MarR family transcriptional regulator
MAVTRKGKEAEARVLAAIAAMWEERGYPPTYRELGDRIGIAHSAVHGYVRTLSEAGLVHEEAHLARSLRLSDIGRTLLESGYLDSFEGPLDPGSV